MGVVRLESDVIANKIKGMAHRSKDYRRHAGDAGTNLS